MQSLESIHGLDVVIVVFLGLGALIGAWRGVVKQVLRLIMYVVSVYAAIYFNKPVADFLKAHLREVVPSIPQLFSYVIVFLAVYLALWLTPKLVKKLLQKCRLLPTGAQLDKAVEKVGLMPMDRLLGAGVGVVLAGLFLGTIFVGSSDSSDPKVEAQLRGSRLRPVVMKSMQAVLVGIPQHQKDELYAALQRLEKALTDFAADLGLEGTRNLTRRANEASDHLETARTNLPKTGHPAKEFEDVPPSPPIFIEDDSSVPPPSHAEWKDR